jgi:hypothetical protein
MCLVPVLRSGYKGSRWDAIERLHFTFVMKNIRILLPRDVSLMGRGAGLPLRPRDQGWALQSTALRNALRIARRNASRQVMKCSLDKYLHRSKAKDKGNA